MSNESDSPSTAAPTTQPGPDLLRERTLSGIFVHLFGVASWFILPSIVYLVSDHDFTRANARNAINWQVLYTLFTIVVFVAIGAFGLADTALPGGIPSPLDVGLIYALGAGVYGLGIVLLLNLAFSLVATVKAIFGGVWTYPLAPDIVGWLGTTTESEIRWWVPVGVYALVAPMVFATVVWLGLGNDVAFWPFIVFFFVSVLGSPLVVAALYRDARSLRSIGTTWQPRWTIYVGFPLGVGVVTYVTRAYLFPSANPEGDAVYAFMAVFWVACVVYLYRRRQKVGFATVR